MERTVRAGDNIKNAAADANTRVKDGAGTDVSFECTVFEIINARTRPPVDRS